MDFGFKQINMNNFILIIKNIAGNKWLRNIYFSVAGLGIFLLLSGLLLIFNPTISLASVSYVPITVWQNTPFTDWNQITFRNFPGISSNGSFVVPGGVIQQLGYDPSRQWWTGQTPDQYMMLGDFQEAFRLQDFRLSDISYLSGLNLSNYSLADSSIVGEQTLETLLEAIPDLGSYNVSQVPPIKDLLAANGYGSYNYRSIDSLLRRNSRINDLKLSDISLSGYSVDSIPGLRDTQLKAFDKWQSSFISEVPGLSSVPFSQFPSPLTNFSGIIGTIDIAFGPAEQYANRTISGSDREGFNVPCTRNCAHTELSEGLAGASLGKQWVSGKYTDVRGGRGVLGNVNGGREPTGRHPFGKAFKVAVYEVTESTGTVETALFFRICIRTLFVDLGCTPYFIGPVPFINYQEGDPIFLGV